MRVGSCQNDVSKVGKMIPETVRVGLKLYSIVWRVVLIRSVVFCRDVVHLVLINIFIGMITPLSVCLDYVSQIKTKF